MNNFCMTPQIVMGRWILFLVVGHLIVGFLGWVGLVDYSFWVAAGTWIGSTAIGEVLDYLRRKVWTNSS